MSDSPITFIWDGEVMRPLPKFQAACDGQFVVGYRHQLVEVHQRSQASHNHYFAVIHESWQTLPEGADEQFPTPEHLRKYCLIKSGYADSRQFVASTSAEALRLAAFIRPCDEYAVVLVRGNVVTCYTAQSQSVKAMGKEEFGKSKKAVLGQISAILGAKAEGASI